MVLTLPRITMVQTLLGAAAVAFILYVVFDPPARRWIDPRTYVDEPYVSAIPKD